MPNIHLSVVTPGKPTISNDPSNQDIFLWNVDVAVGRARTSIGINVKLVQYLLYQYAMTDSSGPVFPIEYVDGKFGPKSEGALLQMQKFYNMSRIDKVVNPMTGTGLTGPIHHSPWIMVQLNNGYYKNKTGNNIGKALAKGDSDVSITDTLMGLKDEPDMPDDLRASLQKSASLLGSYT